MSLDAPSLAALASLDDDAWVQLVGLARRELRGAADEAGHDVPAELDGASAVELFEGPGRQALAAELAGAGWLWERVAEHLRRDDEPGWRERLRPPEPAQDVPAEAGPEAPAPDARRKERIRVLTEQRDQARRQVEGAEVRARAAEGRADELATDLAVANERVAELEAALEVAASDRAAALDRQRRQLEGEVTALREELRALRRAEDERRAEERRRTEAEEASRRAAEKADADARRQARTGRQGAVPGRPSRLPPGVQPGTVGAARALLTPAHEVLVDGYNVTLTHRGHLDLEQQRSALIAILEATAARAGTDLTVFFDSRHGSPPGGQRSRAIRVRFTAPGVTADDEIVFAVEAAPDDQPLLVVTDDRELRARLRPYAVDLLATGEFLRAVE